MLHSSLGFHTMTLFTSLCSNDVARLIQDLHKYSKNTGNIRMFHVDGKGTHSDYHPADGTTSPLPTNLKIRYYKDNIGIKWDITFNNWDSNFQSYIIKATINPKILSGIPDYITAATYHDMGAAITNFNHEAKRISPLLKSFKDYKLNRLDYCLNFDLKELAPGCDYQQIISLIKSGNIPPHFQEWTVYDSSAHRKKSRPESFYLYNSSTTLNCYSKYMQLQNQTLKNEQKGYPPVPLTTLDAAHDIIRFEVQCKYSKMYNLSCKATQSGNSEYNKYSTLLSNEICTDIIEAYYNKTIGRGDWYSFQNAVHIIKGQNYNIQKEKRLIDALRSVSRHHGISKALSLYQGGELKSFKQTLNELQSLNINPVTIPSNWDIPHIPNLLNTYYEKKQSELLHEPIMEDFFSKDYKIAFQQL